MTSGVRFRRRSPSGSAFSSLWLPIDQRDGRTFRRAKEGVVGWPDAGRKASRPVGECSFDFVGYLQHAFCEGGSVLEDGREEGLSRPA